MVYHFAATKVLFSFRFGSFDALKNVHIHHLTFSNNFPLTCQIVVRTVGLFTNVVKYVIYPENKLKLRDRERRHCLFAVAKCCFSSIFHCTSFKQCELSVLFCLLFLFIYILLVSLLPILSFCQQIIILLYSNNMGQGEKKTAAKPEETTQAKIKRQLLTQGKHHKQGNTKTVAHNTKTQTSLYSHLMLCCVLSCSYCCKKENST